MSEFGAKRTLVVYGSDRVKKSGLFEVAINSLKANNIEFTELGGVKSNPVLTKVREGVKIAKEFKADSVLAIGGGSVLDSCKAIAAAQSSLVFGSYKPAEFLGQLKTVAMDFRKQFRATLGYVETHTTAVLLAHAAPDK